MVNRKRIPPYAVSATIFLIVAVVVARILQPLSYSSQAFIQSGLLYDKVCSNGSYEMVVCPYTAPPYETFTGILAVLLVILIWADYKRK